MNDEVTNVVSSVVDSSAKWVVGTYTISSVLNWIDTLAFNAKVPPLTGIEAFVEITTSFLSVIPSIIGGIGIIMLYRWKHEARLLKETHDHIVELKRLADEQARFNLDHLPILKASKNPPSDEPTVDLK